MSDYILKYKDCVYHFFHLKNHGLCMRTKTVNLWQHHKIIFPDSTDIFSVFCDSKNSLHAICITRKNEIVYLTFKDNTWKSHTLTELKSGMEILDVLLFETRIGLGFLYSARYSEELLLIHCILGNHALPEAIDKLSCPHFYFFKNRVYYTNSNGILGYRDISDGKADNFNNLISNGQMPNLITYNGKDLLVFKKNSKLYFQNRPICEDPDSFCPILVSNNNRLLLMWQSNDFIRYSESTDSGNSWSGVIQYVNPGKLSQLYHVVNNFKTNLYFGNHSSSELHIYGTNDIFQKESPKKLISPEYPDKIAKLNILVEMQKREISELKKEILRLGEIIKVFKENFSENPSPESDNS